MISPRVVLFLEEFDLSILKKLECEGLQPCALSNFNGFDDDVIALCTKVTKPVPLLLSNRFKNLRYVIIPATGTDLVEKPSHHVSNFEIISLRNNKNLLSQFFSTREVFLWLLVSLLRKAHRAAKDVEINGLWERNLHLGTNIYGKTLGVLGFGRVGEQIARVGSALGMQVIAYDIEKKSNTIPGVTFVDSARSLVSQIDILSINVDDRKENDSLVNAELLKGARNLYIINTSRGFVVEESAVVQGLRDKRILGFGTDVLRGEGSEGNWLELNPLWTLMTKEDSYNIVITPHIGGATIENIVKAERSVIDIFLSKIKGLSAR